MRLSPAFPAVIDAFVRRCYLAWRLIRAMHDAPRVAWAKARRAS